MFKTANLRALCCTIGAGLLGCCCLRHYRFLPRRHHGLFGWKSLETARIIFCCRR